MKLITAYLNSVMLKQVFAIAALIQQDIIWLLEVHCFSRYRLRPKYKRCMDYTGNEHI